MVKHPVQPWAGSWISLSSPVDFTAGKYFMMKVFSPRVGTKVLLKLENAGDANINYEKTAVTTKAGQWEDVVFDFTGINTANQYHHIVLIFDIDRLGDGSAASTYYFDDIQLVKNPPSLKVTLPLTFENTALTYNIVDFDGGVLSVVDNPQVKGVNTSSKVLKMVKYAGQTWGGSLLTLDSPIDFTTTKKTFKMKVYSPRVGAKVLLKVENLTNGGINYEKEVSTTKANEWEELSFDYSGINTSNSYHKIVLIFDNGTAGDGSANYTFLMDDITLN